MDQTNIFEFLYPKYHVTKPIRLIECFAGYGSQALALKYLGVPFEHWKICEWNYKSFQAYKQLHMGEDKSDYSKGKSKEELVDYLFEKGISSNWNEPMKLEQIKRLGEDKLREIYNNIQATHNLVDISQVHGDELEIYNTDQYTYIMTYSFPCQDLSISGYKKGMDRGANTRSGLLWEVERILLELQAEGHLPDILLMENVPQVHGAGNEENFIEWQIVLEKMGYSNYWQDLIATDFGIPQIRNRTFCISLLGGYAFSFPQAVKLDKRLKDMLENNVDEKYYLSNKMISCLRSLDEKNRKEGKGFAFKPVEKEEAENAKVVTTKVGACRLTDNFIQRPVLIGGIGEKKSNSGSQYYLQNRIYQGDVSTTTTTSVGFMPYNAIEEQEKIRIRKLTPKECFRLMGVKDEDSEKLANMSNSTKYHLAGDSIVTTVLMAIFGELLEVEWKERVIHLHDSDTGTSKEDR